MNPSPSIQAFVDDLTPEDLTTYKETARVFLDEADAALEEAELALKYGGSVNGRTSPADLEIQVLAMKLAVSACETLLHAIQARITSLRLEGRAPEPATHSTNVAVIQATCL